MAGKTRSVIQDLLESIPEGTVLDVRVGVFWSAVVVECGNERRCGLASNLYDRGHDHGPGTAVRDAGALCGRTARETAELAGSAGLIERSIGMATINALLAPRPENCVELNAEEVLARYGENRRVVIVGSFPFVRRLRERVGDLVVLDQRPDVGARPAEVARAVVPQAEVLAITATTLINRTFDDLMAFRSPESRVLVLGPSTPLSPVLFDHGVDMLSGSVVEDPDAVLEAVCQGANFRQIHRRGVRLVTLQKES